MSINGTMTFEDRIEWEKQQGIGNSVNYFNLMKQAGDWLAKNVEFDSYVELGPGCGDLLAVIADKGKEATGIDINPLQKARFYDKWGTTTAQYHIKDLKTIGGLPKADVYAAIEVFEHLDMPTIKKVMAHVGCRYFFFSSTPIPDPDFDDKWGHVSVQSTEKWDEFFKSYGFEMEKVAGTPTKWTRLYKKLN